MGLRRFAATALVLSGAITASAFYYAFDGSPDIPANLHPKESVLTPPQAPKAAPVAKVEAQELASPVSMVSSAVAALPKDEPKPEPAEFYDRSTKVGPGDTLMKLLVSQGVERRDAHNAIVAMKAVYNPRYIVPGQELTLTFQPDPAGAAPDSFVGLTLAPDVEEEIRVSLAKDGAFKARKIEKPLAQRLDRASGTIDSSLYLAAMDAGVPDRVLMELIMAYSWDVDFQRDIRKGDAFEVMYELYYTDDGKLARTGNVLYANLTLSGERYPIYRFKNAKGRVEYYDAKGRSAQKALMRTPINGARLSSGYGRRKHPILGYTKMHRGIDFAAPRGTPIFAAGDGVIEFKGRKGGYGNYIRIRHNNGYSTAYAHMNGFARKMYQGRRVRQGQVIGYVGSTGRSTGPHLHYEIMVEGRQTNPLKVRMPSGERLKGTDLAKFNVRRAELEQTYASLPMETTVANAE